MVLASVTRVLQLETGGAEGQTYSLFRQSSSIGSGTLTHPARSEVMAMVRRVAVKEHSAALDRLTSSISAIMKLGAGTDESPFTKVKTLISDFPDRLQAEVLSEMRDTSSRDERMSKATEKKENLEADVANMKFDAGANKEPFMKVKGLVMGLISRYESSSQASQKAYCNEEMSKHAPVPQTMEELVEVALGRAS